MSQFASTDIRKRIECVFVVPAANATSIMNVQVAVKVHSLSRKQQAALRFL